MRGGRWLWALVLATGCGRNPYFDDDEGSPQPQGSALSDHPDHLSLPYVAGAQVGVSVRKAEAGWTLKSDTPAVFSVGKMTFDNETLSVDCTAGVPGQARISAVDSGGSEQRAATVTVASPDGAKIIAHGPARLLGSQDADPTDAEIADAQVLTGGTGVVAVAYFRGVQRLYGRGIAQASAQAGLVVEPHTASGLPVNEYLFLKPAMDGAFSVDVGAGGQHLATLPVTAVPETSIASLAHEEQVGGSRNDGDQVWILAQARDASNHRIYGAYSTWTLAGAAQLQGDLKTPDGDLYRYKLATSGTAQDLVATRGAVSAKVSVTAHSGQVYDTTYLGCTVGRGRTSGSAPSVVLVAVCVAALALRSSRRRTAIG
jgi:hypothetical protein